MTEGLVIIKIKHGLIYAEKLLEEIMGKVDDGELPDAAETEAQWSAFVTTLANYSPTRDFATYSTSSRDHGDITDSDEHHKYNRGKNLVVHMDQITEEKQRSASHSIHKRELAPVDQGTLFSLT